MMVSSLALCRENPFGAFLKREQELPKNPQETYLHFSLAQFRDRVHTHETNTDKGKGDCFVQMWFTPWSQKCFLLRKKKAKVMSPEQSETFTLMSQKECESGLS